MFNITDFSTLFSSQFLLCDSIESRLRSARR